MIVVAGLELLSAAALMLACFWHLRRAAAGHGIPRYVTGWALISAALTFIAILLIVTEMSRR